MKLIRPAGKPEPGSPSAPVSRRVKANKPQWLRDWIEDQGSYVLLSCGHKENMNDRSMLIIARISGVYVICDRCRDMAAVVRHMGFLEYADIPAIADTQVPLF